VLTEGQKKGVLGIVGGMGPLASAEFLCTIYEHCLGQREQEAPRIMLDSDPTFPDRTEALLANADEGLLCQLTQSLARLRSGGASRIVICCITIHHLLPRVPGELRQHVISLLDVIFSAVAQSRQRHLLFCTKGTRRLELFQKHQQWPQTQDFFVLPDERDQERIHNVIYDIKKGSDTRPLISFLEELLAKYRVDSLIAGCTETHILAKRFARVQRQRQGFGCIDPLVIIAQELAKESL
jgi:aspartate racemase